MTRTVTRGLACALSCALALAASMTGTALAGESTRYVIDFLVVTVRSQPGEWAEVVSRLSSGDPVELTGEVRDGYARVVLPGEGQGWVDARYLSDQPTAREQLDAMIPRYERLREQHASSQAAQAEAEASLVRLSDDYAMMSEELKRLRAKTAEPEALQRKNDELKERLALAEMEAEQLRRRNRELDENENWVWFLTGAGVLLAGIVLGFAIPRGRRRRSSWDSF